MTYKILIVDDSRLARMAMVKALKELQPDWQRLEAVDAGQALELAAREQPQIALMDFNMPGRDGLELAAALKALDPGIRLALVSANTQMEIIARARDIGAVFLTKPLTTPALASFLAEVEAGLQTLP